MATITFQVPIEEIWLNEDDFDGYVTEDFEYEYDDDILEEEIIKECANYYDIPLKVVKDMIMELYIFDTLKEFFYSEEVEDRIKERLYNEAMKEYDEIKKYREGE